jgi:predicted amidohydrolase
MSLTGYVSPRGNFNLAPFAEALDGPTRAALSALARRHRVALAGPLVEQDGARLFNSLLLFDDAGSLVGHWRKRHPWIPETWATPGDLGSPVVSLWDTRITAGICYDLHFLPNDAAQEMTSADVLLFPSAWVEEAPDSRKQTLSALARRFHIAVLNANWGRGAPRIPSQGGSLLFDTQGQLVAEAPQQQPPAWISGLLLF